MIYLEILKLTLPILIPLIANLVSKTNLPYNALRKYKQLDKYGDLILENLAELKQKIVDEPDSLKKELRLEGFELGIEFVEKFANKLLDGVKILKDEQHCFVDPNN